MKSKSFDPRERVIKEMKENKSFKFVHLYKSADETINEFDAAKWPKMSSKMNKETATELETEKERSRSPNKRKKLKKKKDISNVDATVTDQNDTDSKNIKAESKMKSIMKNKQNIEEAAEVPNVASSNTKPKKRSKSVSFMLEDADEVTIKKSKSSKDKNSVKEEGCEPDTTTTVLHKKKKHKQSADSCVGGSSKKEKVKIKEPSTVTTANSEEMLTEQNKKVKTSKQTNRKQTDNIEDMDTANQNVDTAESRESTKKQNKKKRKAKSLQDSSAEVEEPVVKAPKKELKPETIAKGLENLNIGDNPHTLTSLLDEMTVAGKKKKNKNKQKNKKSTKSGSNKDEETEPRSEVEREKWKNRKWNKEMRKDAENKKLTTAVIVDKLPINIMCTYKTLLSEHFNKCGTITGIGIAEAYPNENPNTVFTTTVYFKDEDGATKALEEDNTKVAGSRIRVRRPLPPEETTVVVRAYAEMTDQAISSIFSTVGRIRGIRHLVKGKGSISTAFVEFDGPEAVERAINLVLTTKINGKKMYAAKFENRSHSSKAQRKNNENTEILNDNDSS